MYKRQRESFSSCFIKNSILKKPRQRERERFNAYLEKAQRESFSACLEKALRERSSACLEKAQRKRESLSACFVNDSVLKKLRERVMTCFVKDTG